MKHLSIVLLLVLGSCERSRENSVILGENYARESLAKARRDSVVIMPIDKVLIENEQVAIEFAEVILFKVYGRGEIERERPYEIYNIDGYWVIMGTIEKGYRGGAFEIIFNSKDGQIIRLVHYK